MAEHPIVEAVKADPVVKAAVQDDVSRPRTVITQDGNTVAVPTSTAEEDRGTAGQREVNMLWESTQRVIALAVIFSALFAAIVLAVFGALVAIPQELQLAAAVFLFGVANLVTGFYFGRTNHQRVGGIPIGR